MIYEKIKENRSHRSFTKEKVKAEDLEKIVDAARVTGSGKNRQSIRFVTISNQEMCDKIFSLVKFAGAIKWDPVIDESPRGYIALCHSANMTEGEANFYFDMGMASQSMTLMANELGYKCCLIGSYNKSAFDELIDIPNGFNSYILIALGVAQDNVKIVDAKNGDIQYWREGMNHFVPKLSLEELIIKKI